MRDLPFRGSRRAVHIGAIAAFGTFLLIATTSSCMAQARTFDCLLEPRQRIKLATPIAGVLKEVPVDRGDVIHKGDVLARLESGVEKALLDLAEARAESDANIKSREARLKFLTKKRERTMELQGKGAASTAALDEVESDYGMALEDLRDAKSNLRIAQLDVVRAAEVLKMRSIVSPIDGVVAERNLLGGEYAYEQAPIMTIAQINPLNVEVFVPIALYDTINIGMEAIVSAEQPVGGQYTATVEVVDPLIDSRSGTFGIRLLLPNPNNKIPAGLRCKIEFPTRSRTQ
jgi:membrane fusion protein (multidrug efflux system)